MPYFEVVYGVSSLSVREVRGEKFSALAERELLRDVSAQTALHPSRLKDEPRQGFLSVQLFERERPLFGYCFSSGDEGLFCDTIFPKKPLCPIARKRRAMTGFIRVPFFKKKAIVIVCFMTCHDGVL